MKREEGDEKKGGRGGRKLTEKGISAVPRGRKGTPI